MDLRDKGRGLNNTLKMSWFTRYEWVMSNINESCDILGMSHGRVLRDEERFIELMQV